MHNIQILSHTRLFIQKTDPNDLWSMRKNLFGEFCRTAREPPHIHLTSTIHPPHIHLTFTSHPPDINRDPQIYLSFIIEHLKCQDAL